MTKDSHLMFEKYITSRNSKNLVNEAAAPLEQAGQSSASQAGLEQAQNKRLRDVLDIIHGDKKIFDLIKYQLALSPAELASFLEWAKKKAGGAGEAEEGSDIGDISGGEGSAAPMGEGVEKANKDLEDAKNLKPKSEETEAEYLDRRDKAIKAAIAAKEEAEEHMAMQSHYNTQNQALDLIDGLLKSPKKYQKADTIKILSLALDKLNGKA